MTIKIDLGCRCDQVSTEACKNVDISRDINYHPENKVLPFVPNSDHKDYQRQKLRVGAFSDECKS